MIIKYLVKIMYFVYFSVFVIFKIAVLLVLCLLEDRISAFGTGEIMAAFILLHLLVISFSIVIFCCHVCKALQTIPEVNIVNGL